MKITIVSQGPWIIEMYDEDEKLCKEDADKLWDYMISSLNTTQYQIGRASCRERV